eukprot:10094932-Heterocapsa_arctica.AAC.1
MDDHDRGVLRAELDVAARTLVPRIDGEQPEILMLADLNRKIISKCQSMAQEYAQAKRDLVDSQTEASNVIVNWEAQNQELRNSIIRLEDD